MKLINKIINLNKIINKEKNLGFVPTMGSLHKGHESLINISKKKCKKTIVSIFVNPTQFNNKNDFNSYPRDLIHDLKILKKLKVDYVYLPTIGQIYNKKKITKIRLGKSEKILCANFRKNHFEGVLNVINRFTDLISPKIIFMGEKDYQQFFLVKNFIKKKYKIKVYLCKTIRHINKTALSSRNALLNKADLKKTGLVANELINLKKLVTKNKVKSDFLIENVKNNLVKNFKIKIEYLECRNLVNLSSNIKNKPFKLFVAYYLNNVRIIDNF